MHEFYEIEPEQMKKSPFELIGKDWMLITAKEDGKLNTMTASWGGLGVMWNKNVAFIVLRPQRYTKEFVDTSNTFSLSFFDDSHRKILSYLGSVSGRDENKIETSRLTVGHYNETPYFEEANMVVLCNKLYAQPFQPECFIEKEIIDQCYPKADYHTLYIAEITKILKKD